MSPTIMRILCACIVAAALAVLLAIAPRDSFAAAAAAAWSAAIVPAADGPGSYEHYVAPVTICPGNNDATLPNAAQVAAMACLIDYARGVDGHNTLRPSPLLATSSGIKADDIVRCQDFSHRACGQYVDAAFEAAGYVALRFSVELSENLACGRDAGAGPRSILRAWLESDAHRANLLNERWLDGGVALRTLPPVGGSAGRPVWVTHFGRREAVAAEFSSHLAVAAAGYLGPIGLKPSVSPARAPSGRLTSFRFLVTSMATGSRRPVAGASVFFATHRARTNAQGRATIVARLRRPGRYRAISLSAGRQATVSVQISSSRP